MRLSCRICHISNEYDMTYEEFKQSDYITCKYDYCNQTLPAENFIPMDEISNLTDRERWAIQRELNDTNELLIAFSKLKEKDIIEFSEKIAPYLRAYDEYYQNFLEELRKPCCPRCASTNFTTGQRGFSLLTGFIGSNQTVNRCSSCGYTWKPKKK